VWRRSDCSLEGIEVYDNKVMKEAAVPGLLRVFVAAKVEKAP
jgi:hypothetical protein